MRKPPLERVETLFHQAAELAPDQRATFLDVYCAGDTALRSAVEELLKFDTGSRVSDSFLASPISRVANFSPGPVPPAIPGYELLEELGCGGMGIVYKARQTVLNRLVALKMVLSGPAITTEHLARFRIEAEALARLQHPNIVQIFEVGEQEGRPYFSMEYVAGPSLAHQLQGGPQPIRSATQLVEVVARAVHHAHERGIIHRDLKPSNILLQNVLTAEDAEERRGRGASAVPLRASASSAVKDFTPKVTDFGLAKLIKDQPTSRNLTEPGQALGTPSYMAPEQAWGKLQALGPATDVYALGAILYELVTGKPPFEGETPTETILQLLFQEPVPPTHLRPKLPGDLETICLKCLEKEPRKRYASALALAEDLHRLQAGEPIKARPVSTAERAYRWCRRRPMVTALLAVTASLALALVATILVYNARLQLYNARLQHALAVSQQQAEEERKQLVHRDVLIGMRSLEEGDAFMGLLWFTEALRLDQADIQQEEKHRTRIAMALLQCPHLVQLLVPDGSVLGAQLSAAGSWMVVTGHDRTIRVRSVMTGEPEGPDLPFNADVLHVAISPDGRFLATTMADNTLRILDRRASEPLSFLLPEGAPIRKLAFESSGRVLLTQRDDFTVQLWDLTKNVPQSAPPLPQGRPRYSTFSADGKWVFIVDADHVGRVWDTTTGKALPGSLKLEQDVTHAALSPDGCSIALIDLDNQVRIGEVATGRWICAPWKHPCLVTSVSFSPQGDQILTTGDDNAARIWQVATGELLNQPLRHDSVIMQAQFSPDGRLVVTAGSDNEAHVWEVTTGEAVTPPLKHNGSVAYAVFSADGEQILTIGNDDTARVWQLPKAAERNHGKALMQEPVLPAKTTSSSGRRLTSVENANAVQVTDAVTGVPIGPLLRHASKIESAELSPDGRWVLTTSDDNTAQVWDAVTGNRLIPPCQHKGTVLWAAFSPDGRRLITASEDHTARVWDATTGEPLTPPLKRLHPVVRANFSPDGKQAITVCPDGSVRVWSLTPDDRPMAHLVSLAHVLAGSRVDEKLGVLPLDRKGLRSAWQALRSDDAPGVPASGR
jgi:WD40 repeat protein/serine/threonine protein kinase